jgi:hypothetical protein
LPLDRYIAPEMSNYTPIYHRQQFLLVPVMLNNRERRLFALDSGMRMSTMTSEAAHLVSSTRVNFTNPMPTVGGGTVQIYRDHFDFQFANISFDNQAQILEFDPSAIDENAGFEIVGFSMSRSHWSRVFSFYFIALSLSAVVCCGCSALLFSAVFLFAL